MSLFWRASHLHCLLPQQALTVPRPDVCTPRIDDSRHVAKAPGHDLIRPQFRSIGAAIAARTQLVARLNLLQSAGSGGVEFHRSRSITANPSVFGSVDNN